MAPTMGTYLLIRPLPGVGRLPREEVKAIAARSNDAVRACHAEARDAHIKWVTSYLTDDSSVCVYKASSPEVLKARVLAWARRDASSPRSDAHRAPRASAPRERLARAASRPGPWTTRVKLRAASRPGPLDAARGGLRAASRPRRVDDAR